MTTRELFGLLLVLTIMASVILLVVAVADGRLVPSWPGPFLARLLAEKLSPSPGGER